MLQTPLGLDSAIASDGSGRGAPRNQERRCGLHRARPFDFAEGFESREGWGSLIFSLFA